MAMWCVLPCGKRLMPSHPLYTLQFNKNCDCFGTKLCKVVRLKIESQSTLGL